MGKCPTNIQRVAAMGSVGGWVFVLDVTKGLERRKFYLFREIAWLGRFYFAAKYF